jgi:hypothetical protein
MTLSHFCPTAASMLFEDRPARIARATTSLAGIGPLEGFDARQAWPPLLREGILMDFDSYSRWEALSVETLANSGLDAWTAIVRLERIAEALQAWTPSGPSLEELFDAACRLPIEPAAHEWRGLDALVRRAVPAGLTPPVRPRDLEARLPAAFDAIEQHRGAVGRWLAAKAFASWIAYQSSGLHAVAGYLRACLDVLTVEAARDRRTGAANGMLDAIRSADLLLVHLADSAAVAREFHPRPVRRRAAR